MHLLIAAVSSARQPSGICRHAANFATCLSVEPSVSRLTLLVGEWQARYFRNAFGLHGGGVEVVAVEIESNAYARNRWYYRTLPRIAHKCGADIVHLAFPVPVRRESFPCPVSCSLHDLYPYDSPLNFGYMRVLFNRVFLRQCLKASDAIICSSDFTLDRLRHRVPEGARKATRIYQCVTLDPDDHILQEPAAIGGPFLLAVAQHRRNKNLHLLLSAFAELRCREEANDRLRLVIVGAEGPETASLHSLVRRLSLRDHVRFEPALSDADLCRLYQRCELMIVPSSVEGFCFPVVEALRCGSRVLCSNIPVLREIGGLHCRYFNLEQEQPAVALAQAIAAALLAPPNLPFTSDRFSPREIACQYVALYSRLAAATDTDEARRHTELEAVPYDRYAS